MSRDSLSGRRFGGALSLLAVASLFTLQLGGLVSCASSSAPAGVETPVVQGATGPEVEVASAGTVESYGQLGTSTDPIPFTPDVRAGVLPNGLRYFIRENRKPEGRAYLRVAVDAGSVLETEDERGLAHFVEHMAFNGTERFPKSELIDYLRSLGMRFGPEINAYTSFDETVYGIEVPTNGSTGREVPSHALDVIEDWSRAISFNPEDVEAERGVILEEYRTGLGAMDRINRKLLPAILGGSPYAERLPIGLPEIIKTAPAQRLADFYHRWYRPDNMALIFVGDFDADALEVDLRSRYAAPAASATAAEAPKRPRYELPVPRPGRVEVTEASDPELTYGFVELYYKQPPAQTGTDLASYKDLLMERLLDTMLAERFQDATTVAETPYAAAWSGSERFGKASHFYSLGAVPEPGKTEDTLRALLAEKESIRRFGFTEAEIQRAKKNIISNLQKAATERDKLETTALSDEITRFYLSDEPMPGPEWEAKAAVAIFATVGVDEVAKASAALFAGDDLTAILVAPEAEASTIPGENEVKALVAEASAATMEAPKSADLGDELLGTVGAAGTVVSETRDHVSDTTRWELSNGARVIVKPTTNKNDEIAFYALARGGKTDVSPDDDVSAALVSSMSSASGLGPFSLPDLTKMVAGKQVSLSYDVGNYSRGMWGSSSVADLKTLFELIHLSFASPRIDDSSAASVLDRARTVYQQRKEDPNALFADAVTTTVTSDNPRFAPLTVERLAEASVTAARGILQKQMNPGDFTFVFVGNIDPVTLRGFSETYLASLEGRRSGASWTDVHVRRPGAVEKVVRKGLEDKSKVFLGWYAPESYSERSLAVADALDGYLDIKLVQVIREKLGGTYSPSVSVGLTPAPSGELSMSVSFTCDPARVDELVAATIHEIDLVRDGVIEDDVFTKAIEALKKRQEEAIQSNGYLASTFAVLSVLDDLSPAALYARPSLYGSLTPRDIKSAADLLTAHGPARVTLYPATKQE